MLMYWGLLCEGDNVPLPPSHNSPQAAGYEDPIFVVHVVLCNVSGFIQCTVCRMSLFITMILVLIRALAIFSSRTVSIQLVCELSFRHNIFGFHIVSNQI